MHTQMFMIEKWTHLESVNYSYINDSNAKTIYLYAYFEFLLWQQQLQLIFIV